MTSRPELLQRTASGGAHTVPNRGRPPSHFSSSAPATLRQSDNIAVVDLTLGETDKRLPEASSGKTRTSRPAARNIESKHLSLSGLSLCGNACQAKFQARGRPQLYFEDAPRNDAGAAVATTAAGVVGVGQQGHVAKSLSSTGGDLAPPTLPMPLPPRPGMLLREDRAQYEANVLRGGAAKRNVKAGGPETPPEALCFPNGKPVDFFPWNGSHPEDALTEAVIKNGFANKPQIMNENGTARPAVWTHLKNKSGLQTLSSLFIAMLEKRQNAGRLTAPSSFKPPPRVTLTDTKREAWLRDLANPAIALRRLSRTIPHGIRGKLLLEQCLGKNIPTPRAVWLAKCVGANEMRAFKRKGATGNVGVGSEVKWVKEWTSFVEQFVESIVSTCGQAEWKAKMDYSIRLATHLYNDRLLDSDHYLDWILTSLEGSSSEKLPIWILFIKIYWKDLTGSRRRGSRLAESLLAHVQSLSEPVEDNSMSRLRRNIDQLLLAMLKAFRKCLLLPKTWKAYLPVLQALAGRYPNLDLQKELQHVQRQNERLVNGRALGTDSTPSQEKEMLSILDTISHKIDIAALSSRCISVLPEPRQRILFLLRWACSIYRCGEHRIYIALRLLRKWHHMGVEVDKYILEFLATSAQKSDCEVSSAFRIVADLIRSKTFSAGKYLQWLIATGALTNMDGINDATPCHLRLIAELPFETLPSNVTNLRQTILRHTGLCESESQALADLQIRFIQDLQTVQDSTQFSTESLEILGSKGIGVKLALSRWLREYVYARSSPPDSPMADDREDESLKMSPIGLSMFCLIRDALEEAQDFPILADVLGLMLSTSDYSLLGTIADTLHYHSLTFAAIGALVPLLSQLTERYSALRAEKLPDKPFLRAYVELCTSVRVDPQLLQLLKYDLYRIEQQTNVAVCSPASDNMGDIQSGNMDLDDEFDRILSSGSTMDEQMMGRMFKRLVVRLAQESNKGDSHSAILTSWFPRLRAFDEKTFDRLVQEWVSGLILEQQLPTLHAAIPTLVVSSCFTLDSLADCSTKLLPVLARHHMEAATVTCREILDSVLPGKRPDPLGQPCHAYRYRLMQSKFCADPKNLLQLVRLAIVLARPNDNAAFNNLFTSDKMVMALKPLVLSSPKSIGDLSDQLSKVSPEAQREKFTYLRLIFDALFDPSGRLGLGNVSLPQQVREMVGLADEFSLPFCRLEVQTILHQSKTLPDEEGDVWKALSDAIRVLVDKNSPIWFELISGFSDGITRKIRENAEAQILAFVPSSLKADSQALQRLEDLDESALQRHLAVVSFAGPSLGQEGQPQVLASIIERLRMISEFLNVLEKTHSPDGEASMGPPPPEVMLKICSWIEVLLRLAVIHRPFFQSGKATASHLAGFLWLLRSLLLNSELQNHMLTLEYIFDVAAFFSDDLTDEMRIQLSKLEGSKGPFDARTAFIFGASPSPDGWLGLVSPQLSANQPTASQPALQTSSIPSANGPPSRTSSPITPNPAARPQTPQHRGMPSQKPGMGQQQQPQQQFLNQLQTLQRQNSQGQTFSFGQQQQMSSPIQQQFAQPLASQGQAQPQQIPTPSATPAQQQHAAKQDLRPVPFTLRRWEILPDPASSAGGNDTALSLTLFGARKVI